MDPEEKKGNPLVREEFAVHMLNQRGKRLANELAESFSELLNVVESTCMLRETRGAGGRELALVRTHLEQASFYAKRAMAIQPENQE